MLVRLLLDLPNRTATDIADILRLDDSDNRYSLRRLADFIKRFASNQESGTLGVNQGATKATATLTFTDNPTADETFVLCNITFTGKASGATGDQWNITSGGTAAADAAGNAASVAALINAHATLSKFLTATAALGVVTITCDVAGDIGNALQFSEALTNATISGFVTADTGDDGTLTELVFG